MGYQTKVVQDCIGSLLLAWDRYKVGEGSEEAVGALLEYLADTARVKRFGTIGEVVPFEPFKHYVIDAELPPSSVEVVQGGVYALRDDDSVRTVTRALVSTK